MASRKHPLSDNCSSSPLFAADLLQHLLHFSLERGSLVFTNGVWDIVLKITLKQTRNSLNVSQFSSKTVYILQLFSQYRERHKYVKQNLFFIKCTILFPTYICILQSYYYLPTCIYFQFAIYYLVNLDWVVFYK